MVVAFATHFLIPKGIDVIGPTIVALGWAAIILGIARRRPELGSFNSPTLQFFGNNGYCIYLTHLPVFGLMHGFILGATPDLQTPAQLAVCVASLPVCVLVGWGLTKLVEEPLTRKGRSWRWAPPRSTADHPVAAPQPSPEPARQASR